MTNCICAVCQWKNRWEATYKQHLKDYPTEHTKKFISQMRKTDKATLTCLYIIPPIASEEEMQAIIKAQEDEMRSQRFEELN